MFLILDYYCYNLLSCEEIGWYAQLYGNLIFIIRVKKTINIKQLNNYFNKKSFEKSFYGNTNWLKINHFNLKKPTIPVK